MRRRRKQVAALLVGVTFCAAAAALAWRIRPLPTTQEVVVYGDRRVVVVRSRTHRLLSFSQWGTGGGGMVGCGPTVTVSAEWRKFIFFVVEDMRESRHETGLIGSGP
jgi:hypothetical protein